MPLRVNGPWSCTVIMVRLSDLEMAYLPENVKAGW